MNNRQRLLGLLAIAALALLVGDKLILTPLAHAWKDRSAEIRDLKKSVNQGELLLDREQAIQFRWASMRTNAIAADVAVAENQVLSAFDQWSRESRIGISAIKPQWKRNAPGYATLECRVDAFGDLSAIARFLYEIERVPLGLKVDKVEITSRDDRGEQLTLALQLNGLQLLSAKSP